ncbi:type II toxin-antitoxin system HipA family toxin [Burkholderia multivorans]|uniref:type II toxin-antitoxin system HipA family toxin n=1 Tax=Burkholderia multivorans TaxID=87883 RepID=UPI0020A1A9C7|nr:type II toxin-antitoxin system HipA family toxin [Burkholderia multivorans]MCO8589128.1 type II toxin-antitoxin system HipA family toxin [Burkholderia multivorans]MCO8608811.1 type II toxin-antitoxin system HipA family toxin [Burkholderia multivorans]MCO8630151.1 type II toxin-antitoxin system HipA family toxin [Burkholderia multivorans]MCO8636916.1 type II toxin-antitoxin system HipA family toxin [Burkholderia multivorans]
MVVRTTRHDRLDLWMNGIPVGYWEVRRGVERLVYLPTWIDDPQGRPLSLSLPFTPGNQPHHGAVVAGYFDNLLPDSQPIRRRIAQRYRLGSTSPFELLASIGRDCVGALQLLPPDETPVDLDTIEGTVLDDAAVADVLRQSTAAPLPGHAEHEADLRLSIAGAQEKTALLHHGNRWLVPSGSTPTTHIFKLPLGRVGNMQADMRTSVENEWLCSKIVAAYGLPVAHCDIGRFDDQKVLIVERFDRRLSRDGTWILRLPQEDMCQATGTPPAAKYESDGGPGIDTIMGILANSVDAARDRMNFFVAQLVFWVLAAIDGHAKNFSIALLPGNTYRSTPLYDVLSAHPIIGTRRNQLAPRRARLAMAVSGKNRHYAIADIQPRHWIAQGRRVGLSDDDVRTALTAVAARTEPVIAEVAARLPADFPADVADAIFDGMRRQSRKLIGA